MNHIASAMHLRRIGWFRSCLALILLLFTAVVAHAQTPTTNCVSFNDLVNAIDINRDIIFNCSGTIAFENPITIQSDTTLDGGDNNVTLSGNDVTRLFTVQNGVTLTLRNLTITKGRGANGGAIFNRGTVIAADCVFNDNEAPGANGANGRDGAPDIARAEDGQDGEHGSAGFGGVVYNQGVFRAMRCTFSGNTARGGDGGNGGKGGNGDFDSGDGGDGGNGALGQGGAIYNRDVAILIDCSFENNSAQGGKGGTPGEGGTTGLAGNPGHGGTGAAGSGGAIHSVSFLRVDNCTFADNTGAGGDSSTAGVESNGLGKDGAAGGQSWGGGIASFATSFLVNCTFSTNKVSGGKGGDGGSGDASSGDGGDGGNAYGGCFFAGGGVSSLTNCTFSGGSAIGGTNGVAGTGLSGGEDGDRGVGAGGNIAALSGGVIRLLNNIIARPTRGGNGFGPIADLGYNMSSDATIPLTAVGARINTNPRLLGLADNGGPTRTFALRLDSPAINTAHPDFSPERDQRGRLRSDPDRGAYEYAVGDIFGEVVTPDGAGVPDVDVVVAGVTNTTDAEGNFQFLRLPSDTYTVTPVSTNFVFDPPSEEVDLGGEAFVSFIATPIFPVSGRVQQGTNGLANVLITAISGKEETFTATTRPDGTYSLGLLPQGSYTLEPTLEGLTFTPQIQFINVDGPITNANFAAGGLQSVSGRITDGTNAIPNITVNVGGQTVTTDFNGNYNVTGLGPYTYDVIPQDPSYGFVPPSRTVTLSSSAAGINFIARPGYAIAGVLTNITTGAGIGNVVLTLDDINSTNNAVEYTATSVTNGGHYAFSSVVPGTYILRPSSATFAFSPRTNLVTVGPSQTNLNFGGFAAFSVNGVVTLGGAAVTNVTIRAFLGTNLIASTTTTNNGSYVLRELSPGTYDITARRPGIRFTPLTNTVSVSTSSVAGINFTGEGTLSIGGVIQKNGVGLANVRVSAGPRSAITDSSGTYVFSQLPPGEYSLTPALPFHNFDPPTQTIVLTNLPAGAQTFDAYRVFNISGNITAHGTNLPNVRVTAGTNVAVTGLNGNYEFIGLRGPSQTLVPERDNFAFNPASTNVPLPESVTNVAVNFTASSTLFTLGGRITDNGVGVPDIPVFVGSRTGITDSNGYYVIPSVPRGTHTVQPTRTGYQFTPGFQVVDLQAQNTNVNFTAIGIYSISGRIRQGTAGLPNVRVTVGTRSTTTDADGNYNIADLGPRQQTIVPVLDGYAFDPQTRSITLDGNQSGLDFAAFPAFSLSGAVFKLTNGAPFTNITVNLFSDVTNFLTSTLTDTNGAFTFTNLAASDYKVEPALSGHDFTPGNRVLAVPPSASSLTFTGFQAFTMRGNITFESAPLTNVVVAANAASTGQQLARATSNVAGDFILPALPEGNYDLVPSRAGFQFSPSTRSVFLRVDTNNLNFTATGIYSISGRVTTNGVPVEGASITASNKQVLSDASGFYTIPNLAPGTYNVAAEFARYAFQPTNTVVSVGPNRSDINFDGVQVFTISGAVTENGVGLAGVAVSGGGVTHITDSEGNYILSSVPAGTVTVTATRPGYEITPPQRNFVLNGNVTGADFSARGLFFVRGRIIDSITSNGLAGITNTAGKYSAVTDLGGNYTITNMGPGTYSVQPSFPGRGFAPTSINVTLGPLGTGTNNVNFTSFRVFRLSGKVTREGTTNAMPFVSIRAASEFATNTVVTDLSGVYQFPALRESSNYVVTASQAGNAFDPAERRVELLSDKANEDFVGYTAFNISGRITENGVGLPGVELALTGSNLVEFLTSDASGNYNFTRLRAGSYTIMAARNGYGIAPPSRAVTVGPSAINQDFTATAVLTLGGTITQGTNKFPSVHVVLTSTNFSPAFRRSVITDTNGRYLFTNLAPNLYFLRPHPAGVYTQVPPVDEPPLPELPDHHVMVNLQDHTTVNFTPNGGRIAISDTPTNNVVLRVTSVPTTVFVQANTNVAAHIWRDIRFLPIDTNGTAEITQPRTNSATTLFRLRR